MRRFLCLAVFLGLGALVGPLGAQEADSLRFAKIFTDSMVLQQGKPIIVWGWAEPSSRVSVTLTQDGGLALLQEAGVADVASVEGDDGGYSVSVQYVEQNPPVMQTQVLHAEAGDDGRWEVTFEPAEGSFQPTWVVARAGDQIVAIQDVLIGEVWLCAGQSNMVWSNFNRKGREAASADFPGLRYVAWEDSWYKPLEDIKKNVMWRACSPDTAQSFSAVPYLFGMFLHRYLKTPVGVINVARGGTLGQTWCLREELDACDSEIIRTILRDYDAETSLWEDPQQVEQLMKQWRQDCEQAEAEHERKTAQAEAEGKKPPRLRLPKAPGDPRSGWSPPAGLFNATVMPIRQMGLRGVLYYQGENQAFQRWTRYEYTFPKIPVSFRKAFGDEHLAFGCISQPGWGQFGLAPEVATVADGYAIVRDIQRRALANDPNAGMIATYPTGNSYIHPAEKLPVAEYASLWALANVYDQPVVHRANNYQSMKQGDGRLYLYFDSDPVVFDRWKHIEDNAYWQVLPCPSQGNADLRGFIIAGEDRRWYPAKAKHKKLDGQWCIEVWSDLVPVPVAARYGWANWPTGNLQGREGLPLATFRTDDWPLVEGESYTPEVKERCRQQIDELKKIGLSQSLDRQLRQMQVDVPKTEAELFAGDRRGLVQHKISRVEAILEEISSDDIVRGLADEHPDLVDKVQAIRDGVLELKKGVAENKSTE